jgi:hypothetical protein
MGFSSETGSVPNVWLRAVDGYELGLNFSKFFLKIVKAWVVEQTGPPQARALYMK